ncbi:MULTISPECIES: serine/threonine-protein kinase [Streptomyces]|uniref:non-specific serine/threonine protein kinase n=2 Tax=Streptomyces fradiae ATCC 10745 = DSM 40063 TaxID=1319510 RepID=A0A1Y2NWX4_STRFR|nr:MULTISPECIES: serine/threonine-protein kinase [Streptomyces]OSY51438.1 Serine/threonine-protein kinase PknB [Streptomyces fradiae ATCC 10745 = DSM 40063]
MEQTQGMGGGLVLAGRYRLGETIGRGGMGKVWRAHDEVLHRTVAVKELTAGQYVSEADRVVLHARTQKEARAAARITHPAVVTVHDVLEHDDRPWIVMQYVDGPSLADSVKSAPDGRISPREAARIGLHVLGALSAAHAAGVLHRDVKPGNVLLARDGRVLLTDFGIAAIEGDSTITRTGELVGSIDYLAPERVRGSDPGPASDLWALGATLYTAVQGQSPFRRSSPISTMQAVVTEEAGPAAHAGPLAPVITALLRKDPADRPGAAELERMLIEAMEGRTPTAAQAYVPTLSVSPEELREVADGIAGTSGAPGASAGSAAGASHGSGASSGRGPGGGPGPGYPAHGPGATVRAGAGRLRRAALVVLLAGAVGAGAGFAVMRYADHAGTAGPAAPAAGATAGAAPSAEAAAGDPRDGRLPAGWRRVTDPLGFSLAVPAGWERRADGDRVDYTPDGGRRLLRVSVDSEPDFESLFRHMLDVEKSLRKRLPEYRRVTLVQNTFRDRTESCLWEFTWHEKRTHPGKRHAIDQVYYTDDGTEYALYMSSPEEDWATTREQFGIVLRHWRPAEG